MINYKKFTFRFSIILILLILFHFSVWNMYTKYVFPEEHKIGDLGRMSYLKDSLLPRDIEFNLPKKHIEVYKWDGRPIDVLVLGDSFSNGGGSGQNSYYQDYISSINNFEVLNIKQLTSNDNYLNTIAVLNNSGFLKKANVKYVLIESVERESVRRFTMPTDVNMKMQRKEIDKKFKDSKNQFQGGPLGKETADNFISNLNVNAFLYNILYNFKDNAYSSNVYKHDLEIDMFSSNASKTLLTYKHDYKRLHFSTRDNIKALNDNFNKLAESLGKNGIKLYFMPAVDKYNLYSSFIVNNKYPSSTFFEYLRELPKKYTFIDTKEILLEELKKGKKDIYYSDDTHWSYKASKAIFEQVKFD